MKVLVDEMPLNRYVCPFSEILELSNGFVHDCKLTGDYCDLVCGVCSGLKVLETKE